MHQPPRGRRASEQAGQRTAPTVIDERQVYHPLAHS